MSNLETGLDRAIEADREPDSEPVGAEVLDTATSIDLDLIERDLRDVETTLARLADGTYFADRPAATAAAPGLEP